MVTGQAIFQVQADGLAVFHQMVLWLLPVLNNTGLFYNLSGQNKFYTILSPLLYLKVIGLSST